MRFFAFWDFIKMNILIVESDLFKKLIPIKSTFKVLLVIGNIMFVKRIINSWMY
jgi:hypothetical protein